MINEAKARTFSSMDHFSHYCQETTYPHFPLLTNIKRSVYTEYEVIIMKKKTAHHRQNRRAARPKSIKSYLVLVRSWMFLVMFALMLGAGVILGNVINQKINETTPQVAGYQTEILR